MSPRRYTGEHVKTQKKKQRRWSYSTPGWLSVWGLWLMVANPGQAESLPKWELGAGIAAFSLPDYPGADQQTEYVWPIPYVVYRGEYLRAGRGGLRGMLYRGSHLELDVSTGGSLPVNSDDNEARRGMEDLDPSFELGPSLRVKFIDDEDRQFQLRLNARALVSVDDALKLGYQGWLLNPELRWISQLGEGLQVDGILQWRYGSRGYHDHFYTVTDKDALPERPAYQAERGHSGYGAGFSLRWQPDRDWRWSVGYRYFDLHNVAFDDSPLFRQNHGHYLFLSFSRTLWRSQRMVSEPVSEL